MATDGFRDGKQAILTVTERRILVISREFIGWDGASQTIDLDKISSISEKDRLCFGLNPYFNVKRRN